MASNRPALTRLFTPRTRAAISGRGRALSNRYGRITEVALFDRRLTDRAVRILGILAAHATFEAQDGYLVDIYPGMAVLAERLGCHRSTVDRAVKLLVSTGYLEVVRQERFEPTEYRMPFPPAAAERSVSNTPAPQMCRAGQQPSDRSANLPSGRSANLPTNHKSHLPESGTTQAAHRAVCDIGNGEDVTVTEQRLTAAGVWSEQARHLAAQYPAQVVADVIAAAQRTKPDNLGAYITTVLTKGNGHVPAAPGTADRQKHGPGYDPDLAVGYRCPTCQEETPVLIQSRYCRACYASTVPVAPDAAADDTRSLDAIGRLTAPPQAAPLSKPDTPPP